MPTQGTKQSSDRPSISPCKAKWRVSRFDLFKKVDFVWRVIFLSLLVDPFLAAKMPSIISENAATFTAALISGSILPLTSQQRFHRYLSLLRATQADFLKSNHKIVPLLAVFFAILIAVTKVSITTQLPLAFAAIVALIIVIATFQGGRRILHELRKERDAFTNNPYLQVARWEDQVCALSIIPFLLARSLDLLGIMSGAHSLNIPAPYSIYTLLSLIFLLMLKPRAEFFKGYCPKCKQPVPLVVTSLGSCLRCDASLQRPNE